MAKLTPNMEQALRDLGQGNAPRRGAGRSASGGYQTMLAGLHQRGLVARSDDPPYLTLTEAGRAALARLLAKD